MLDATEVNRRAKKVCSLVMLTDVARTGEQIDRVLNSSQFSGGALNGEPRPMSLFGNETDFWAQGINAGLVWER